MPEGIRAMDSIKDDPGPELFTATFPIILTDSGTEFHDPLSIETDPSPGTKLIQVYFCKPRRSDEKGKCEKNHVHFRECVPRGVSMEPLSKRDINHVSNMVNNEPREMLNYHSPYEVASLLRNEKVFKLNKLKALNFDFELTPIIS